MEKNSKNVVGRWTQRRYERVPFLTQNCVTKTESDFTEATSKAKELVWSERKNNPKCWLEQNDGNDVGSISG